MIDLNPSRIVEHNGQSWAIGAHWSGPDYLKKPGNIYRLTNIERLDPERSSVVHMPNEMQIGWYVFASPQDRPKKRVASLAQLFLTQVFRRASEELKTPLTAVLNLGPVSWLIILDQEGHILPGYELWGDPEDIADVLRDPDRFGLINAFRANAIRIDNPDKAWAWLLEGVSGKFAYAEPLKAGSYAIRQAAIAAVSIGLIVAGGYKTYLIVQSRREAALEAQQLAEQAQQQAQFAATQADLIEEKSAFNSRLEAYWANYLRPWAEEYPASALISACRSAIDRDDPVEYGWLRTSAICTVTGGSISVAETWKRGTAATVFKMPQDASFNATGDFAQTQMNVTVQMSSGQPVALSPSAADDDLVSWHSVYVSWLGTGQQYETTIKLIATPFTPFKPPVPSFVPQSQISTVQTETPNLWQQENITVKSQFAPWDGWPMIDNAGFVIESIDVDYVQSGSQWTLVGEQYAR